MCRRFSINLHYHVDSAEYVMIYVCCFANHRLQINNNMSWRYTRREKHKLCTELSSCSVWSKDKNVAWFYIYKWLHNCDFKDLARNFPFLVGKYPDFVTEVKITSFYVVRYLYFLYTVTIYKCNHIDITFTLSLSTLKDLVYKT